MRFSEEEDKGVVNVITQAVRVLREIHDKVAVEKRNEGVNNVGRYSFTQTLCLKHSVDNVLLDLFCALPVQAFALETNLTNATPTDVMIWDVLVLVLPLFKDFTLPRKFGCVMSFMYRLLNSSGQYSAHSNSHHSQHLLAYTKKIWNSTRLKDEYEKHLKETDITEVMV